MLATIFQIPRVSEQKRATRLSKKRRLKKKVEAVISEMLEMSVEVFEGNTSSAEESTAEEGSSDVEAENRALNEAGGVEASEVSGGGA